MASVAGAKSDESPYASAAPALIAQGYHAIPIRPASKAPGEYRSGAWRGMAQWQRFRDRKPSEFELNLWIRNFPDANVGVVLGSDVRDGLKLMAMDCDLEDHDSREALSHHIPISPMVKRGQKGETRFYLTTQDVRSRGYNRASDGKRMVDILTGNETRQTVVPPSLHATTGLPYSWLSGPVPANSLPIFGPDEFARFEEQMEAMGWEREDSGPLPPEKAVEVDEDDYWRETKDAALANLGAWVPHLELFNLRRARQGYDAVATWRPSNTGRALPERACNLSIQPHGITDFGDGPKGYSPIDLVMSAQGADRDAATRWLRERLGLDESTVVIDLKESTEPPAAIKEIVPPPSELPDELTHIPGLVGDITEWIVATARRPQRGLSMAAAIALVGTAAGRKYSGPTLTGTHLYILAIAETGAGKDHALKQIGRVMTAAKLGLHIGPSQFMSLSAVLKRLTRTPLTLSCVDEMATFIAKMNHPRAGSFERGISGVLRTAWGCSFDTMPVPEWASHEADPIHAPALSIYGASTHDELYRAMSSFDVTNGFLNRFLLISTRRRPLERDPEVSPKEVPMEITDGLQAIYGSGSALSKASSHNGQADAPLIVAQWADAATKQVYADFSRMMDERDGARELVARSPEMAQRMATIRAIGNDFDKPVIRLEDMEWGRDLALWAAERMIAEAADHMAETTFQAEAKSVLRLIKQRGRISHRDLARAVGQRVSKKDLASFVDSLNDAGEIEITKVTPASGGRTTFWYSPLSDG